MSRFDSSTPISPGTTKTGGLRDKEAQKRAKKEKKYTKMFPFFVSIHRINLKHKLFTNLVNN